MGILSWFSGTKSTDYETVLAQLATDINEAKQHLAEIRLRERRFTLVVNAYGVGLWAVILGLWYWGGIPWSLVGWDANGTEARMVGAGGVIMGPFLIWMLNWLISTIFARKRNSEETHLRKLLVKQRNQVDEIKRATNFDSTRKLIEQYEDSPLGTPQRGPSTPMRSSPGTPTPAAARARNAPRSAPNTPGRVSPAVPAGPGQQPEPNATPAPLPGTPHAPGHLAARPTTPVPIPPGFTPEQAAVLQMQMQAIQPVLPTPEKKWYDRLADTILGDDPAQSSLNKYALVCAECFRHNGLVGSKQEWERMQWICPRCNHLNPSPLSRMAAEHGEPAMIQAPTPTHASSLAAMAPQALPTVGPETPSKPAKPSSTSRTHVASPTASPLRRAVGERSARSSRLGKEVFSAGDAEDEDEEDHEAMDLDK